MLASIGAAIGTEDDEPDDFGEVDDMLWGSSQSGWANARVLPRWLNDVEA